MTSDPATERALLAASRTRALGMHFLGHFLGISGRPAPAGSARLTLGRPVLESRPPSVPVLSYSALADLVLGSAIRSHFGPGARLGTVTLAIQHPTAPIEGPLVGAGRALEPRASHSVGQAVITAADRVVGHAQGWFSALPPPTGGPLRLLPWEMEELPPVPALTPANLDESEARALAAVQAADARARARGTTVEDELLHFAWHPSDPHASHGELTVGPELGNRVGHLQGGALYAAGARAASEALGGHGWTLADGYYQFLRPGDGRRLMARAEVLRRGRSAAFVQAHVSVDGVPVGAALYTFQAAALTQSPSPRDEGGGEGFLHPSRLAPDWLSDPSPGLRTVPPPAAAPLPPGEANTMVRLTRNGIHACILRSRPRGPSFAATLDQGAPDQHPGRMGDGHDPEGCPREGHRGHSLSPRDE